ncbi:MAG: hypothetical protein KF789_09260 [Bdellovibrionaceae bacterium]|nr:hypothetical protein [Pseudobdellovibrionaceae bacterium]
MPRLNVLLLFFAGWLFATSAHADLLGHYVGRGDFQSNTGWGNHTDRPMKLELRFLDNGLFLYRDCWSLEPLPICVGSQLTVVGTELWHRDQKIGVITENLISTEYRNGALLIVSRMERLADGRFLYESVYQEQNLVTRKKALLSKKPTP